MINKNNIDVQIYLDKVMEGINQLGILESLSEEWGIEKEDLEGVLKENISYQAEINFQESGDPTLSEDEFEDILQESTVECTLEDMARRGTINKRFDLESMQNVYYLKENFEDIQDDEQN